MRQRISEELEKSVKKERYEALYTLEDWLETPILVLGFIWLILLVIELIWFLYPALEAAMLIIWIIFIIDFSLRFFLAPEKGLYLKKNWLTAFSLIIPALRVFRIFRVLQILRASRAVRGVQLVRVFGTLNRGIKSLRKNLGRRGFAYVVVLSIMITFVGAAGMYAFESDSAGSNGFRSYGDSLWWTAMIMTTLGSQAWPQSFEGRILGYFLSLYAFAVFGYITATLATFFIERDAQNKDAEIAGEKSIMDLKEEIKLLREEIKKL